MPEQGLVEPAEGQGEKKQKKLGLSILLIGLLLSSGFLVWLGLQAAQGRQAAQVPVLLYHDFCLEDEVPKGNKLLTPINRFTEQMQYLQDQGYTVIPLQQLLEALKEKEEQLPAKPVVITFDDGYASNYTLAYPVLRHFQYPATIFLVSSLIEGAELMPLESPDAQGISPKFNAQKYGLEENFGVQYLDWDQVRELERSPLVDIQAHTHALHYLAYADSEQEKREAAILGPAYLPQEARLESPAEYQDKLQRDFQQVRQRIEGELNADPWTPGTGLKVVDTLAWPYGAYTEESLVWAKEAGFQHFLLVRPGLNQIGDRSDRIRRISGEGTLTLEEFAQRLQPDRTYWRQGCRVLRHMEEDILSIIYSE